MHPSPDHLDTMSTHDLQDYRMQLTDLRAERGDVGYADRIAAIDRILWRRAARELGAEHARNAASWIVDGNTKAEAIAHVVALMDAGDDVSDYLPACPDLSGQWSGDPTPISLYETITGRDHAEDMENAGLAYETLVGSLLDDLCTAYEDGVSETFEPECERILRAAL